VEDVNLGTEAVDRQGGQQVVDERLRLGRHRDHQSGGIGKTPPANVPLDGV
jgi:hypothetical protein